jgi:hypothetical protein
MQTTPSGRIPGALPILLLFLLLLTLPAATASAYMHPTLGRWLQRDPAGYVDGMNVYGYCGGMAMSSSDPGGLGRVIPGMGIEVVGNVALYDETQVDHYPDLNAWQRRRNETLFWQAASEYTYVASNGGSGDQAIAAAGKYISRMEGVDDGKDDPAIVGSFFKGLVVDPVVGIAVFFKDTAVGAYDTGRGVYAVVYWKAKDDPSVLVAMEFYDARGQAGYEPEFVRRGKQVASETNCPVFGVIEGALVVGEGVPALGTGIRAGRTMEDIRVNGLTAQNARMLGSVTGEIAGLVYGHHKLKKGSQRRNGSAGTVDDAPPQRTVSNTIPDDAPVRGATRTNGQLVQDIGTRADAWATRKGLAGTPQQLGTAKHGYASRLLRRYQSMYGDRGLVVERSFLGGSEVPYGTSGSVRLDVLDLNTRAVWDYKFGASGLRLAQELNIFTHGPGVISVKEVRP